MQLLQTWFFMFSSEGMDYYRHMNKVEISFMISGLSLEKRTFELEVLSQGQNIFKINKLFLKMLC